MNGDLLGVLRLGCLFIIALVFLGICIAFPPLFIVAVPAVGYGIWQHIRETRESSPRARSDAQARIVEDSIRLSGLKIPNISVQKEMRAYYWNLPEGNRDAQFQQYLKAYLGTLFSQPEMAGFIAGDDITDILAFRLKEGGSVSFMRFHYTPKNSQAQK